jgi:hypothetical protein
MVRLADCLPVEMGQVPSRPARSPGRVPLRPARGCPPSLPLLATWPGSMPLPPARPDPNLLLLAQSPDQMLQRPVICCAPIPLLLAPCCALPLPARPVPSLLLLAPCCALPLLAKQPHSMSLLAEPCVLLTEYPLRWEPRLPGACHVPPEHLLPEPRFPWSLDRARADLAYHGTTLQGEGEGEECLQRTGCP